MEENLNNGTLQSKKIDYRTEVDSGIDRKILVEKMIMNLLMIGVPPEVISDNYNFNFRHYEMKRNLITGYEAKLDQLEEFYGDFYGVSSDGISASYSEVVHNLQELYPMSPLEEKEKFKLRDSLKKQIEKMKKKEEKNNTRKKEIIINKIAKLKVKYPILDDVIKMVDEMDQLILEGPLSQEIMDQLFGKYNFEKSKFTTYNLIYKKYDKLWKEFLELNEKSNNSNYENEELKKLIDQKNKLEEELIKRNIKLVNYFIRSRYKTLLVEQEELYDICLISMANAMRDFDVSKGYKFSTFAFKCMDTGVRHHFKQLTGYSWDVYWNKNKIKYMLEAATNLLGRIATVDELCQLGLLSMTSEEAEKYLQIPSVYLDSYVYGNLDEKDEYSSFEDYKEIDDYEDNLYSQNSTSADHVEEEAISLLSTDSIAEVLQFLTDRERIVLVLRYGLDRSVMLNEIENEFFSEYPNDAMTLAEIGKIFSVSKENIRRIEAKALRKLKHPSRGRKIKGYIE